MRTLVVPALLFAGGVLIARAAFGPLLGALIVTGCWLAIVERARLISRSGRTAAMRGA